MWGLTIFMQKLFLKTGERATLLAALHYFTSNGSIAETTDKYLGTELDLVYTQPLIKNIKLQLGYSHMFASSNMSLIKNGVTSENTNNWGWAMLVINPKLFNHNFD